MTDVDVAEDLPDMHIGLITAAANEGVPVAAIGRMLSIPYDAVTEVLKSAQAAGQVAILPRSDWPPGQSKENRSPTVARVTAEQLELSCGNVFKLTKLEAGFLSALLRHESIEKAKLHGIVEQQRQMRPVRADRSDPTDPKIVDVMICKLRKKLRDRDPALKIETSWGWGYFMKEPAKKAVLKAIEDYHV